MGLFPDRTCTDLSEDLVEVHVEREGTGWQSNIRGRDNTKGRVSRGRSRNRSTGGGSKGLGDKVQMDGWILWGNESERLV